MDEIVLGRTNIKVERQAFGALPIQRVDNDYAVMLLNKAYEGGMRFFDTARMYTDSEAKVGNAFYNKRDKVYIATKTAANDREHFWEDLYTSLKMLKTDYIDIYQFHNPTFCPLPGDGTGLYESMLEAKERGLIRHIGITNHRFGVAETAVSSGLYETLQFPFCYLASDKDVELQKLCKQKNVGFIAMKALSGGLITNARAACAWISQFDNVLPIWGIQRESELCEMLAYIKEPPLFDKELEVVVENDRRELFGSFCRACGYCMPCPANIQINNCARMSQLIRRSPSKQWLTNEYRQIMFNIENCINCGACKKRCPYNLDVPSLLKKNLEDYKDILKGKCVV